MQFHLVIYSLRDTSLFKPASIPAGRCIVKCSCLPGFISVGLVSALQDAPSLKTQLNFEGRHAYGS